jgi:hypothetical protein
MSARRFSGMSASAAIIATSACIDTGGATGAGISFDRAMKFIG